MQNYIWIIALSLIIGAIFAWMFTSVQKDRIIRSLHETIKVWESNYSDMDQAYQVLKAAFDIYKKQQPKIQVSLIDVTTGERAYIEDFDDLFLAFVFINDNQTMWKVKATISAAHRTPITVTMLP